jgi:hypothetical protein
LAKYQREIEELKRQNPPAVQQQPQYNQYQYPTPQMSTQYAPQYQPTYYQKETNYVVEDANGKTFSPAGMTIAEMMALNDSCFV